MAGDITNNTYTVKSGDNLSKISKLTGKSVKELKELNPQLTDINKIQIGQLLSTGQVTTVKTAAVKNKKTQPAENKTKSQTQTDTSKIMTQDKFESEQSQEVKNIKADLKKAEGKKASTYIAPEGKSTIGYGHQLVNKPQFLKDIEENKKLTVAQKTKKLNEALKNKANKEAFKASLQKDLQAAIDLTGIKDVPSTVSSDLKLTDAQMELLLNADLKKAENLMTKTFGKDVLAQRQPYEKEAALDAFYNVGDLSVKAENFVAFFKAGDMANAQKELDIFRSGGKVQLGLIKRAYSRMQTLNNNNGLNEQSQQRILIAYNEDCRNKGLAEAKTFAEIESKLV